ncbi:sugar kinase [Heliorestis convoluta]|uniref:PfkB carbohydrate kinase family protein n=1 Tax=Heliorestis convoluta TaxID=356322 RepID=A0A5Q2N113_9FIRM|nr:sugar kinase [Heliorestis convoluta]QGG46235.1 pfkB carbohydrate kinase family protein [Heliorestis convoluta]
MAQIITIGEILVEIMAKNVGQRFHQSGEWVGPFPSGAPAIFIDQAARCGSDTMIVGAVGNDGFGKINIDRLHQNGVNISKIKVLPNATTGVAFVTYNDDGSRDFLFHIANAACGTIEASDIEETLFQDCKYFHIMGSAIFNEGIHQAIIKGIEWAQKKGSAITFDPNVRKEIITNESKRKNLVTILEQSQIILAGEDELYYLTGVEDEQEIIRHLLSQKAQMVLIKRGRRGASLYIENKKIHVEALKVEEVDPTGAGDCFAGTFVSCLNQGIAPVEALYLANIAGARAVTQKGPMEGNTSLAELKKIYQDKYS